MSRRNRTGVAWPRRDGRRGGAGSAGERALAPRGGGLAARHSSDGEATWVEGDRFGPEGGEVTNTNDVRHGSPRHGQRLQVHVSY